MSTPSRWSARLGSGAWTRLDRWAAVAYGLLALPLVLNEATGQLPAIAAVTGLAAVCLPIAERHTRPTAAFLLAVIGLALIAVAAPRAAVVGFVALAAILYCVAALCPGRTAVAALAAAMLAAASTALPRPTHRGAAAGFWTCFALVWALGYAVGAHRRGVEHQLREQALLAQAEIERAHGEVSAQRMQLARELHDVIAHSLTVITVQAGYAGLIGGERSEPVQQALTAIETSGRQALQELRRMLDVLRAEDPARTGSPLELTPAPGLADLDRLVQDAGQAGLHVELTRTGDCPELTPGIELAAYRVVQESLTNVAKHADTEHARVTVRHGTGRLEVIVIDRGRGTAGPVRAGHGLVGMRERVELYGGTFSATSEPGGFEVRAILPVPQTGRAAGRPGAKSA
jgi:signal transduction histidine kinase